MRLYLKARRRAAFLWVALLVVVLIATIWSLLSGEPRKGEPLSGVVGLVLLGWVVFSTWSFERTLRKKDPTWTVSIAGLVCWGIVILPKVLSGLTWELSRPESLVANFFVIFTPAAVALDLLVWLGWRVSGRRGIACSRRFDSGRV